jgi:chromosome partitioning protein
MSTYTVANLSGSVGKTTTVVTTAVQLAATGLRVRVIDLDPQANASTWLGYPDITGTTIADVLRLESTINDIERPARIIQGFTDDGEPDYTNDDDTEVPIDNLTVVPAARSTLDKLMVELPAVTGGVLRLRDALEAAVPVDVTLIDSPGSNSALVTTALIASSVEEEGPDGAVGSDHLHQTRRQGIRGHSSAATRTGDHQKNLPDRHPAAGHRAVRRAGHRRGIPRADGISPRRLPR